MSLQMSVREYLHQQHLARRRRMTPQSATPKLKGRILYGAAIGPERPPPPPLPPILTLEEVMPEPPEVWIPLAAILVTVAEYYRVRVKDMQSPARHQNLIRPRFVYYYLARILTSQPLTAIGKACGGRDHATVDNGLKKLMIHWDAYAGDIHILRNRLAPPPKIEDS